MRLVLFNIDLEMQFPIGVFVGRFRGHLVIVQEGRQSELITGHRWRNLAFRLLCLIVHQRRLEPIKLLMFRDRSLLPLALDSFELDHHGVVDGLMLLVFDADDQRLRFPLNELFGIARRGEFAVVVFGEQVELSELLAILRRGHREPDASEREDDR